MTDYRPGSRRDNEIRVINNSPAPRGDRDREEARRKKARMEKLRRNRRRRRIKKLIIRAVILAVVFILGGCAIHSAAVKKEEQKKEEEAQKKEKEAKKEKKKSPEEIKKEEIRKVKKEAKKVGCPAELIKLIDNNEETLDFIKNYAEKKDTVPAETLSEEIKAGTIPSLIQWDERWGYAPYGTSTIAASGCGPTCMAMVIAGLTGRTDVTPYTMAKYSEENGYLDETNNTYWIYMKEAASNWGISSYETMLDETSLAAELAQGKPVICSVGPGNFTTAGHFIVLTGYQDGSVTVNDPNSKENSSKTWIYSQIASQIKEMWVYSM